jgi:hypothetical protein
MALCIGRGIEWLVDTFFADFLVLKNQLITVKKSEITSEKQ